jgi:hypothetical protein
VVDVEASAMPTAVWLAPPAERSTLVGAAANVLQDWRVRSAFVGLWVRTACERAREIDELRLVLDYDEDARLLSFDAFCGDRRVYGADDWIG